MRFLTAGESHGKGLTVIIEGLPAGLPLTEDFIAHDLARRQKGHGRGGRMLIEKDVAEVRSGVRHGLTLGSPIALWIENKDWPNWTEAMSISPAEGHPQRVTRLRPGHADLPGVLKYNQDDVRNILERASARETTSRVAVGAISRRFLQEFGVQIHSQTVAIGGIYIASNTALDWERVESSPVRCADSSSEQLMMKAIDNAKAAGDTVGGIFEVVGDGVPIGLGSHVHWDRRLDGIIARAFMSINAVKGVEIGAGFSQAALPGSQVHDIIEPGQAWKRRTNHAGGLEGGMTNGEAVVVRAVVKPIATLGAPLPSVDLDTGEEVQAHFERSDVCQVPPAGVIGEAMLAIVLADAMLEKFGGDHLTETRRNFDAYIKQLTRDFKS